jgi:hypothetical protein
MSHPPLASAAGAYDVGDLYVLEAKTNIYVDIIFSFSLFAIYAFLTNGDDYRLTQSWNALWI